MKIKFKIISLLLTIALSLTLCCLMAGCELFSTISLDDLEGTWYSEQAINANGEADPEANCTVIIYEPIFIYEDIPTSKYRGVNINLNVSGGFGDTIFIGRCVIKGNKIVFEKLVKYSILDTSTESISSCECKFKNGKITIQLFDYTYILSKEQNETSSLT